MAASLRAAGGRGKLHKTDRLWAIIRRRPLSTGKVKMIRKLARPLLTLALVVALGAMAAGCGSSSSGSGGNQLSLVAYSTPKEAYAKLIPAFQRTSAGGGVTFSQSYGGSGDQARAVAAGLPADVVALSLAPDVDKLVKAGAVASDWSAGPTKGFVTNSIVVFVVRKGNSKGIRTWDDLVKPGLEVLEPNPFTSGGARWNVMAAYGAQIVQGKSEQQATDYLGQLFKNVPVQDKSARDALQTFAGGKGDVLISYENEAIAAKKKGLAVDYVVPPQTILIQNPIAVTTKTKNAAKAKAFVDFLESDAGQRIFAASGYRPVKPTLVDRSKFPSPPGLFAIDKLGGWATVTKKFFDPASGVVAKIEQQNGVSTGG
jgi:sulfate transport system substrate-binding protein